MTLNIKNPEAHALAAELARRTGASMTEAVTEALREKLAAVKAQASSAAEAASREQRRANMRALAKTIREGVGLENLKDPGELLYDDLGLPK